MCIYIYIYIHENIIIIYIYAKYILIKDRWNGPAAARLVRADIFRLLTCYIVQV